MQFLAKLVVASCALSQVAGFLHSVPAHVRNVRGPHYLLATNQELYDAATVCSEGGCSVEAVEDLKSKLAVRKDDLMQELAKVQAISEALGDLSGKKESDVKMMVNALVNLFSPSESDMPLTGVAIGYSMDPSDGTKDSWDYDMSVSNYKAEESTEVGQKDSNVKMVGDAVTNLFSPSESDLPSSGVATGFTMDPTDGVKDAWDYDMAWKNYYAKLKEEA
uniref:Uncharacterized protein n=1 Tax=Fibrocapsa japonica TaxID=94617 RepID=A0A7S2V5C7_9STRA|mmetsp:Transcript_8021/g.12271  ORF Transcript_8021/g.12271 Transcript_8021/m.12271 type:complete len:220 (+) Transcript_8021:183-842(+)